MAGDRLGSNHRPDVNWLSGIPHAFADHDLRLTQMFGRGAADKQLVHATVIPDRGQARDHQENGREIGAVISTYLIRCD
jgi:hypothetical protein